MKCTLQQNRDEIFGPYVHYIISSVLNNSTCTINKQIYWHNTTKTDQQASFCTS